MTNHQQISKRGLIFIFSNSNPRYGNYKKNHNLDLKFETEEELTEIKILLDVLLLADNFRKTVKKSRKNLSFRSFMFLNQFQVTLSHVFYIKKGKKFVSKENICIDP